MIVLILMNFLGRHFPNRFRISKRAECPTDLVNIKVILISLTVSKYAILDIALDNKFSHQINLILNTI